MSDSKTPEQIMREQVDARVAEERGELPSGSAQGGSDLPGGEHSSPPHGTCPPGREAAQGSPASTEDCAPKLPEASNDFVERCLDANELGDGMLFAYLFQNRHAYVGQADEWLYFWGHHWHVDLVDKAHRAAMDVEHVAVCYGRTAMHYRKLAADARAQGDKEAAGRLDSKAEKLKARAHKLRSQSGRMRCLDFAKTKGHMVRACMEGVALSLRHNLEVAEEAGADAEVLRAMGGSANSLLWTQIKSDITGKPIVVPASDTATTLGAAILAGVGVGFYKDYDEAVSLTVKETRRHEPNPENKAIYDQTYQTYLELYKSLAHMMTAK